MIRNDFCVFILSHGRPDNILTLDLLKKVNYTGPVFIVIDNEDDKANQYYDNFGDNVVMFNKPYISNTFDTCDSQDNRKTIVYARNACFDLAKELGYKFFMELDDDYYYFGFRTKDGALMMKEIDETLNSLVEYIENTNVASIAFSQGGDHIGGFDEKILVKRKAMNSFICSVDKPFQFIGRINEDVNTYVRLGGIGRVFLTVMNIQLDQKDTQTNKDGMTDVYLEGGTYVKSFYSVMINPSCVKIKSMGVSSKRLHHSIKWENAVPCILNDKYKIK